MTAGRSEPVPTLSKIAIQQDADALAGRWFALAEAKDLPGVLAALAVGKGRMQAARTAMLRQPDRYARFQTALVDGLASESARLRFESAHALDTFGDVATRAPLTALMGDPVPRVRWIAMHALSCHACGEKKPGGLEDDVRERIIDAMQHDPSPYVRRHAAVALGVAHETSAAPMLREQLARETDPKLRRALAWACAELGRPVRVACGA
jgi:HEAT repeat protein